MLDTKIVILGCGQMGLACAGIVQEGGIGEGGELRVWAHEPEEAARLDSERVSDRLPGFTLDRGAVVTSDLGEALEGMDGGVVVSAIPVQFMRGVWERIDRGALGDAGVVTVSKGLEVGTKLTPSGIIADALGGKEPAGGECVLSGPAIAKELAQRRPAILLAASADQELAGRVQRAFSTSWVRVYTGSDVAGVEVAGALKNVIAIASGILDGMEMGYNAKSALLARGLAELVRIGVAMGARAETFFGVAGVGDLATTCFCPMGRNRSFGEALVKGESLEQFNQRTGCVVEGAATVRAAVEIAGELGVEAPIARAVHSVLYEGVDPRDALAALMSREMKEERVG